MCNFFFGEITNFHFFSSFLDKNDLYCNCWGFCSAYGSSLCFTLPLNPLAFNVPLCLDEINIDPIKKSHIFLYNSYIFCLFIKSWLA